MSVPPASAEHCARTGWGKAVPFLSAFLCKDSIPSLLLFKKENVKSRGKPFSASPLVSCVSLGGFYPVAAQTLQFNSDAAHPL